MNPDRNAVVSASLTMKVILAIFILLVCLSGSEARVLMRPGLMGRWRPNLVGFDFLAIMKDNHLVRGCS